MERMTSSSSTGSLLVLSAADVVALLPMDDAIGVMVEALEALARGEVHNPLRSIVRAPDAPGLLGLMPAYRAGARAAWGLKEVCVYPDNAMRGLDAHQGAVLLHDPETGELLAAINGSAVTAIRTAAVSGVATRLLARESSETLAILGSGVQARSHLDAMLAVRPIRTVRVWSRDSGRARAFATEAAKLGVETESVATVEQALQAADIVVTATASVEPIVKRAWLAQGAHVNAVGSSIATTRELDGETMACGSLFVDRRESTVNESGDYLFALREGAIGASHIRAEIGELLVGAHAGRADDTEVTIFKSLGLAIEDLATAQFLYRRALDAGVGAKVPF